MIEMMKKIKREISLKELKDTVILDRKEYHKMVYEHLCLCNKYNEIRRLCIGYGSIDLTNDELIEKIKNIIIR